MRKRSLQISVLVYVKRHRVLDTVDLWPNQLDGRMLEELCYAEIKVDDVVCACTSFVCCGPLVLAFL